MRVWKSNKFENAYVVDILNSINGGTMHIMPDTAKKVQTNQGEIIGVSYLFYNRFYKKWYEDIFYPSFELWNEIISKIKA